MLIIKRIDVSYCEKGLSHWYTQEKFLSAGIDLKRSLKVPDFCNLIWQTWHSLPDIIYSDLYEFHSHSVHFLHRIWNTSPTGELGVDSSSDGSEALIFPCKRHWTQSSIMSVDTKDVVDKYGKQTETTWLVAVDPSMSHYDLNLSVIPSNWMKLEKFNCNSMSAALITYLHHQPISICIIW